MTSNGLLSLSLPQLLGITLLLTHVTIAAVTIYLHRHQSHRALDLHPLVSHFFRFWLWLSTGMVTREWVAIHRKHHAKVDTAEDPHSPQQLGIGTLLARGTELYRAEARNAETLERFGRGTPDDWLERKLYSRHAGLGIGLMLAIDVLLFGPLGLTVWAVQMIWIPLFAAGVINGIGHWAGYRNHECDDASRNIVPWGILIGGEELHNNHHAFANSARLSNQWWEFDLGWFYIRVLAALGLARVNHVAPRLGHVDGKEQPDVATLQAVLRSRFQLMRAYTRRVIRPVLREEARNHTGIRRAARRALMRGTGWFAMQPWVRERVEEALGFSKRLRLVHQHRAALQRLWQNAGLEGDAALTALRQWCADAERSGVGALERFARHLRGYVLRPVAT